MVKVYIGGYIDDNYLILEGEYLNGKLKVNEK